MSNYKLIILAASIKWAEDAYAHTKDELEEKAPSPLSDAIFQFSIPSATNCIAAVSNFVFIVCPRL